MDMDKIKPDENERVYTLGEVCKMLGISRRTVVRWESIGILPSPSRDWKLWRVYTEEDVNRMREIIEVRRREKQKKWGINEELPR